MQQTQKNILASKLTLVDALALGCTVVIMTLWIVDRFQTKSEAAATKIELDKRVSKIEATVESVQRSLSGIAVDVSYVRGRLEPKQ